VIDYLLASLVNPDKPPRKPGIRPGNGMPPNNTGHESCWGCAFVRLLSGSFPSRRCAVIPGARIYDSPWHEVKKHMIDGKTVADDCPWFRYDGSIGELTVEDMVTEQAAKLDRAEEQLEDFSRDIKMEITKM
jgi:hypothetical protein